MNEMKTNQNFQYITRRIGATTFKVKVVFSDTGQETMEDKILRIVRNEAAERKKALTDYAEIKQQSEPLDRTELYRTRLALRPGYENAAIDGLRKMLGSDFSIWNFRDAVAAADNALGERAEENAVKEFLRIKEQRRKSEQKRIKHHEQER